MMTKPITIKFEELTPNEMHLNGVEFCNFVNESQSSYVFYQEDKKMFSVLFQGKKITTDAHNLKNWEDFQNYVRDMKVNKFSKTQYFEEAKMIAQEGKFKKFTNQDEYLEFKAGKWWDDQKYIENGKTLIKKINQFDL